jgi:hypothetical protein
MSLEEPSCCLAPPLTERFCLLPSALQYVALHQLRNTVFPEGYFLQVPPAEWLHLLRLVDPLLRLLPGAVPQVELAEGRQLLLLLLSQYLDVD